MSSFGAVLSQVRSAKIALQAEEQRLKQEAIIEKERRQAKQLRPAYKILAEVQVQLKSMLEEREFKEWVKDKLQREYSVGIQCVKVLSLGGCKEVVYLAIDCFYKLRLWPFCDGGRKPMHFEHEFERVVGVPDDMNTFMQDMKTAAELFTSPEELFRQLIRENGE